MTSFDAAHPTPPRYRLEQRLLMALLLAVVAGAVGQLMLALLLRSLLFGLGALTLLAFAPFILMALSVAPPLTVTADGLLIRPHWWREQLIPWGDVLAMRPYPLLPRPDQETERRALQGRKRYRAAEGWMLIVHGLPWQYRMAGFFAGAGGQPIIAITNRTHSGYDALVRQVQACVGQ
ncbi:hypothetical protein VZO05_10515 [Aggregatilineales bacterium SYSU G02658]